MVVDRWLGLSLGSFVFAAMLLAVTLLGVPGRVSAVEPSFELRRTRREPVAIASLAASGKLLVANRRSGSLSVVDRSSRRIVAEMPLESPLTGLLSLDGADGLAVDQQGGLWLVESGASGRSSSAGGDSNAGDAREGRSNHRSPLGAISSRKIAVLPGTVDRCALSPPASTDRILAAASTWGRALLLATLRRGDGSTEVAAVRRVPLDFSPRSLAWLPGAEKLLVGDAFGGALALVDASTARVEQRWSMPWHHLGGMAVRGRGESTELLVTSQRLDRGWADRDGVHWGIFLANRLQGLPVPMLLAGKSEQQLLDASWTESLGLVGDAAGDPGVIYTDGRNTCVALHGIDEVLVAGSSYRKQLKVGDGPAAFCRVDDELWVASALDDSLTLINLRSGRREADLSLGPSPPLTPAERGRRLFVDAKLSHDGWMSCDSCHVAGHTSGGFADTLGDGGYGAPKRIPSLLGVGATGPWAWNGAVADLESQINKSVATTMHGPSLTEGQTRDLAAYLRSLRPVGPPTQATPVRHKTMVGPPTQATPVRPGGTDRDLIQRGKAVFARESCDRCHVPPTYTSHGAYDVGVVDEVGNREFNPPSLRGVGMRRKLFHDGRHELESMIRQGRHQLEQPLGPADADALLAFLRSL